IVAFEPSLGRQYIDFLGTGNDEPSIMAVSRFNGGKKGFYLSHVGDLYRTDNMIPATIKFRIRLGSNINNSTVIYEQSVDVQPDTTGTGTYLIAKLDSGILINAYEDFWIEWDYAYGMRFPQGFQWVTTDQQKTQTFYTKVNESDAFQEIFYTADFYMAAYAQTDSTGGWLTLMPDKGSVGINQNQQLALTAHGPEATPPDQSADLIVHSNDPATPETKVGIYLHIDQAPVLTNHDTLIVHEGDTLNAMIPAQDDEDGKITIRLISKIKSASVTNTDSGSYFHYRPGYDDAGIHLFPVSLIDHNKNKRTDTIIVSVLNTNRAPIVIKHLKDRTISLTGPSLSLGLDSVFSDPDGDHLQYSFAGETNPMVKVFVKPSGETGIIQEDTGRIQIPFMAQDSLGSVAYDTLHLHIINNKAPNAKDMSDVVMDMGTSRMLDLSNWFSDPENDVLSYSAAIDTAGYAIMQTNGSDLLIKALKPGTSLVTVTARDGYGGTVRKSFILIILNDKGALGQDYHIRIAPNPIFGISNIYFQLEKTEKVKIELLGTDGTLRAIIYNGTRSQGYQYLPYNFAHLQTGNYMVKFTIGEDVRTIQIAKL
ncbi:MAG TPA: hypothetical protein VHT72_03625, partial [Puia sp.]|nr:hypothetical protein [Puia sp.]